MCCASNFYQLAQTNYPIVLIHGLYGFSDRLGSLASYWGDLPELLSARGATVYVAKVSQVHSYEERGEQLYRQLRRFGHEKYNLIGHSLGGLDARYVLENYPQVVASVTTIGTPHWGSKLADYLSKVATRLPLWGNFTTAIGNALGHLIGIISGEIHEQDAACALDSLTTKAMKRFNERNTIGIGRAYCQDGSIEHNGIRLYSWGSFGHHVHRFDLFGHFMRITRKVFDAGEENDGLVAVCSMKFGKWLGAYEEGHHLTPILGVVSSVDYGQYSWAANMFIDHAHRLKAEGL